MKQKKFRVRGITSVAVIVDVFADSKDDAFDRANEELPGLEMFAYGGDLNKMVGVSEENHSVETIDEIVYDEAEELSPDEY